MWAARGSCAAKQRAVSVPRSPSVQHPVHPCVVADPHQPFGRPQAHALKVVRQGAGPLGRRHPPMIPFAAGLAARPAQPALPPVAATTIFHHRFTPAMLAFHPRILSELPSKSIPNEQSRKIKRVVSEPTII